MRAPMFRSGHRCGILLSHVGEHVSRYAPSQFHTTQYIVADAYKNGRISVIGVTIRECIDLCITHASLMHRLSNISIILTA